MVCWMESQSLLVQGSVNTAYSRKSIEIMDLSGRFGFWDCAEKLTEKLSILTGFLVVKELVLAQTKGRVFSQMQPLAEVQQSD